MDGWEEAAAYTFINVCFYATIIYGNVLFLFPRLFQKGRRLAYVVAIIFFLAVVAGIRALLTWSVYNAFFAKKPIPFNPSMIYTYILGGILVLILSFPFRMALAYFTLKKQTAAILLDKSRAELDLLKSKVQPHFLFNTLNNIYYEAYLESPRTAVLIEKLADIMRYFMEESPKDKVLLEAEVQFIENYIALEQIRVLHGVQVHFKKQYDPEISLPPMLLITFVENIFKHGIDKSGGKNEIELSLITENGHMLFETRNRTNGSTAKEGFGLKNLSHRLSILYGERFEITHATTGEMYTASLKIPLS